MPFEIAFASGNAHKIQEIHSLLKDTAWKVLGPKDLGISFNPEETEDTFLGNSFIKSRELHRLTGLPSFADDSGICVEALGNRPGVLSARYGKPEFNDRQRAEFLLGELGTHTNRNAHYICVISFVWKHIEIAFEGRVDGLVSDTYDGEGPYGFGYDPIFYYPPFQKNFSRVEEAKKNEVSHRGKALRSFVSWLKEQNF
ncbi:non-canonical purine NTP pyrophosphatase [Leptospira ryugenii]|uniref:dITP/XTP pyrophosphatase n=1 Tax=Leptospira ryugenii TaxID=1917863 RepID=A0A2P2E1L1_9LEPT|nr:RdgB/HAM1 family non-canonical purine NTP pyrophosphatase [Leptospira ryugenii]GBF50778.1 non-canonical purine NTP pyrophosphatase [Leptospira ryugenii]